MPTLTEVYENHKVLFWAGGIGLGALVFFTLQSQRTTQGITLATLHTDLQDIDKRLSEENSYLSSSAIISPVSPEIDIGSIGAQESSGIHSIKPPITSGVHKKASSDVKHKKESSDHKHKKHGKGPEDYLAPMGRGPGDFEMIYGSVGSLGFPGDQTDYWGLN